MSLDAGSLAHHGRATEPIPTCRSIEVSAVYYDLAASAASRARLPTGGAGGWFDRAVNRAIDIAEAQVLACPTCRALTPHLALGEQSMLTIMVREYACAQCGSKREHRVLDLGPDPEEQLEAVA